MVALGEVLLCGEQGGLRWSVQSAVSRISAAHASIDLPGIASFVVPSTCTLALAPAWRWARASATRRSLTVAAIAVGASASSTVVPSITVAILVIARWRTTRVRSSSWVSGWRCFEICVAFHDVCGGWKTNAATGRRGNEGREM